MTNRPHSLAAAIMVLPLAAAADAPLHLITPLSQAQFEQDADVSCLQSALAYGNPDKGASTFLLKAPSGCRVPAHYHSAEEQMFVIRGSVLTGMTAMKEVALTRGGVAAMPAKAVHWFSCAGKGPCLVAVTFNQKYDIVWVTH